MVSRDLLCSRKRREAVPDGGKGELNKNLASAGVKASAAVYGDLWVQPAPRGHLALKDWRDLALWTPMVASLGPQCGGHMCNVPVNVATWLKWLPFAPGGSPLSHGHLSREGSICELHGPIVPAAPGKRAWVRWLVKRAWAGHQNQF